MTPNSYSGQRQPESCEECVRLWKEYADLNREFLKAASDREAASAAGDPAASLAADSRYRHAGERRLKARKAVASHKELRHPNVGPARASAQQSFSPTAGLT